MRLFWSFLTLWGEGCVDDDKIVLSKVGETSGSHAGIKSCLVVKKVKSFRQHK